MGRHGRVALLLSLSAALAACGHRAGEPSDERVFTPPAHAPSVVAERADATRIYGEDGALLPSTDFAGGVRLPRGLTAEPAGADDHVHVFTSHATPDKLARYFGPMLVTGAVTRIGEGVVYRGATIRGSSSPAKVDVSILPSGLAEVRVEITELGVAPPHPMSEQEAQRLIRRPTD